MVIRSNELTLVMVNDGSQGIPGPSNYTWIKYTKKDPSLGLTSADLTDDELDAVYLGIALNKPTAQESDDPADYRWTKIRNDESDASFLVVLDNENITFMTDGNSIPVESQIYTSQVNVYKGAASINNFEILEDEIEVPTGLTVTVDHLTNTISIKATMNVKIERSYGSIMIPVKVFDLWTYTRQINFTVNKDNDRVAEKYVWIKYTNNKYPTGEELYDETSARMKYACIAYDMDEEEPSSDPSDYELLTMPGQNLKVVQVEPIYHKSEFNKIEQIPSPDSVPDFINTLEGMISSSQGMITLNSNEWTTEKPDYAKGYYLWSAARVRFNDGSVIYTTPRLLHEWDYKDKIGGAQLIRNSKTLIDSKIYWF